MSARIAVPREWRLTVFALVALICFVLTLFHVHLGSIDLLVLGFAFIALHLLWDPVGMPWRGRRT